MFPVLYFNRELIVNVKDINISGKVNSYYKQTVNFKNYSDREYTASKITRNYNPITYTGECSAGGFAGMTANGCYKGIQGTSINFTLTNVSLNNLIIKGQKYVGGIFGVIGISSRVSVSKGARLVSTYTIPFNFVSCRYDSINLQGAYAVGGFVGVYGNANITFNETSPSGGTGASDPKHDISIKGKNTYMQNSTFGWIKDACYDAYITCCVYKTDTNYAKNVSKIWNFSGGSGAVGYAFGGKYNFGDGTNEITMKNLDLYCPQFAFNCDYGVGSVAGLLPSGSGNLDVKKTTLDNIKIEMKLDSGYIGLHPKYKEQYNKEYYVAPATGCIAGYSRVTKINLTDVTLKNSYLLNGAYTGGYVGCCASININNSCSIDNVIVFTEDSHDYDDTSRAGLVTGVLTGNITINSNSNLTISNSKVISDGLVGIICGSGRNGKTFNMVNLFIDNCVAATTGRKAVTSSFIGTNTDPKGETSSLTTNNLTSSAGIISGGDYSMSSNTIALNKASIIKIYNMLVKDSYVGYYIDGAGKLKFDKETNNFKSKETNENIEFNKYSIGVYDSNNDTGGIAYSNINYSSDEHYTDGYMGFVIGCSNESTQINIVGLSVDGGCYPYEMNGNNDYGVNNVETTNTNYIIFSNYNNNQDNKTVNFKLKGNNSSIYSPYQAINPALSINGVGLLASDGISSAAVSSIKSESSSTSINWNDRYARVNDTISNFDYDTHYTTYKTIKESDGITTSYTGNDFPVLVIDTNVSADIKTLVDSYIATLTNCPISISDMNRVNIDTKTYKCNNKGQFTGFATPSLTYSNGIWKTDANNYDNNADKFTLIDIQYQSVQGGYYHLQIPAIVKKVQNFSVYASILNGTEYYKSAYDSNTKAVLAKNGDKVTARIDYNYYGNKEYWKSLVYGGTNLIWSYDKKICLGKKDNILENGTNLILVDVQQGGKAYYTTVDDNTFIKNDINFDLDFSKFTRQIGGSSSWSKEDIKLCDLLNLSSIETTNVIDGNGKLIDDIYFVKLDSASGATIRVKNNTGYDYYRLANTTEKSVVVDTDGNLKTNVQLYTIEVGVEPLTKGEEEYISESYFLTIQTPENSDKVFNNMITYQSEKLDGGNLPTQKNNVKYNDSYVYNLTSQGSTVSNVSRENVYIIGDLLTVGMKVNTYSDEFNTSYGQQSVDVSITGNIIYATLTSDIKYSSATIESYAKDNAPYIYQKFVLNPLYFDENRTQIATKFPSGMKYKYTLKIGDTVIETSDWYTLDGDKENITIKCTKNIYDYYAEKKVTEAKVIAEVEFDYVNDDILGQQFPLRPESEDVPAIKLKAESVISFVDDGATVYNIPDTAGAMYARNEVNHALLTYYAWDNIDRGDGTGSINQLGINPSDPALNPDIIYTEGDYNYSSISEAQINSATSIKYELTLYQKNNDKDYIPVDINKFLSDISISNGSEDGEQSVSADSKLYTVSSSWKSNSSYRDDIVIKFKIKTGDESLNAPDIEGFVYANYKVELKVSLLDGNGNLIANSDSTDYIIYTNARINTDFMNKAKNDKTE